MSAWDDFVATWAKEERKPDDPRTISKRLRQDFLEKARAVAEAAERAATDPPSEPNK